MAVVARLYGWFWHRCHTATFWLSAQIVGPYPETDDDRRGKEEEARKVVSLASSRLNELDCEPKRMRR